MRVRILPQNKIGTRRDARELYYVAGNYDPGFIESVHAELNELMKLPKNWDGYGAPLIDPVIVAAAKKFVEALPENLAFRPRVVPMSPGNFQFEWQHGSKSLELEFESATTIRYLQWHPEAGISEEGTFRVDDTDEAIDLIQWFMNGTCVV